MDNVQLSKANQVYISQQAQNKNTTSPIQPQVQQVEDGENKMNKVLLGLGILGAAAIGITCAIRGKKLKNTPDKEDIQKLIKKFDEISFNKQGIAKLKDGTLFTGTVEKASNNGDKISMEYVDGVLKKSTKTTKGSEIIKEYTNGVVTKKNGQTVDIKKVQDEVKKDQDKLKQLLKNDELSADDFKKQADEIKFKSNNNKKAIEETFDKKVKAQEAAKAEADKLAQEAQEKAQKEEAERLAKEQQEAAAKAQKEAQEKASKELAIREEKLKKIEEQEEKSRLEFISKIKNDIPVTYEERFDILIKNNTPFYVANKIANDEESFANYMWSKSPAAQKFYDLKVLARMDEKQKKNFQAASKVLEENGIKFSEHELLQRGQFWSWAPLKLHDIYGGCAAHGDAYGINQKIRYSNWDPSEELSCRILDKALETVKPTEKDLLVYRGVSRNRGNDSEFIERLLSMKKGEIFTDKAYSYSSFDKGIASHWARDCCFLEIKIPKGAKVSQGLFSEQAELLFPRNSQFKVIEEAMPIENGKHKIVLEYILPKN